MAFERWMAAFAALLGAAGVAALAASAHGGASGLFSAGLLLLAHAAAVLALSGDRLLHRGVRRIAMLLLVLGAALFAADMAARVFGGGRLFPLAAPAGGLAAILGWLCAACAAVIGRREPV